MPVNKLFSNLKEYRIEIKVLLLFTQTIYLVKIRIYRQNPKNFIVLCRQKEHAFQVNNQNYRLKNISKV